MLEVIGIINGILAILDIIGGIRLIYISRRREQPQLMIAGAFIILFIFISPSFGEVFDLIINFVFAYVGWGDLIIKASFDNWG